MSTTTGTAPESHATESSRSMRRRLGGSAMRVNDEDGVDVGGQHLDVGGLARVAARDGTGALEHGFDERGVEVVGDEHGHPVADSG